MALQVSTLRPGLIVSLKTNLTGNVIYRRLDIEPEHLTDEGSKRAAWETTRVIEEPEEHDRAIKVRSRCRSLITGVCAASSFGLLCPERDADKLEEAIRQARELAEEFNAGAKLTRIGVYIIVGKVNPDDVEAIRAINSEVRDLLDAMKQGVQALDVKVVRESANKAREMSEMLSPAASERLQDAIRVARSAARRIVKAGTDAAVEIDEATLRNLTETRLQFLDLSEDAALDYEAAEVDGRAIDLGTVADEALDEPEAASPEKPLGSPQDAIADEMTSDTQKDETALPGRLESIPGVFVPQIEIDLG